MANVSKFERALRVYKGTYDVNDTFFMDVIGIKSRTTWNRIRHGAVPLTVPQFRKLSDVLGMSMDELYEMLPDINH